VRDTTTCRVFLGATHNLSTREAAIIEMPGIDLPLMLPRGRLWEDPNQNPFQQQPRQQYPGMAAQYGVAAPADGMPAMSAAIPMPMPVPMPMPIPMPAAPTSAPKTPEQETPTKRASSRKRKQTTKAPTSRKRAASSTDGNENNRGRKDSQNESGIGPGADSMDLSVNLVQIPEVETGTALARQDGPAAVQD
jgi:hypothetical protein